MILKTTDKLLLAAIAVALILGIVVGRGCGDKPITHNDGRDSVIAAVKASNAAAAEAKRVTDSVTKANKHLASYVEGMTKEKDKWQRIAGAAEDKAEFYASKFQQAVKANDTPMALESCDSLAKQFHEYQLATVQTLSASDSIIRAQDNLNANLRIVMEAKEDQILALTNSQKAITAQYTDLFKDYKKERRKDNWFNKVGKPALGVIAGGLIVYAIKH